MGRGTGDTAGAAEAADSAATTSVTEVKTAHPSAECVVARARAAIRSSSGGTSARTRLGHGTRPLSSGGTDATPGTAVGPGQRPVSPT